MGRIIIGLTLGILLCCGAAIGIVILANEVLDVELTGVTQTVTQTNLTTNLGEEENNKETTMSNAEWCNDLTARASEHGGTVIKTYVQGDNINLTDMPAISCHPTERASEWASAMAPFYEVEFIAYFGDIIDLNGQPFTFTAMAPETTCYRYPQYDTLKAFAEEWRSRCGTGQ